MYDVHLSDVTCGFVTGASLAEVDAVLAWVNQADACLEGAGVTHEAGVVLKLYAVRHVLALTANGGQGLATQQSSASGASRSFRAFDAAGLGATSFGLLLRSMDKAGCVTGLFSNDAGVFLGSVGPSRCRT